MAVGMFKLSQKKRKGVSVLFIVLSIIQILLGFCMSSTSLYIIIAVSPVLHTEKAEINFAFAVTGIFGTHVIFHWIVGIKICYKCFRQAHKKSTNSLLILWSCLGTNTVVNLLIISHFVRKMNKHISKSIKQSIMIGMNHYLSDISWKETIDRLQYSNECCGVNSFEDWHEKPWMTKYHVDTNSENVNPLRQNKDDLSLPVTPWSCCKVDFPMQCLHDPLQQAQYKHMWVDNPNIVESSINTKGCFEGLKKPITAVISLFIFFSTAVFVLHILIFFAARILYTSSRNAILLNDPEGIAPGWIFGRGDCGYTGGKTLAEIMGNHVPQPKTTIKETDETKPVKKKGFKNLFSRRKDRKNEDVTENGYVLVPSEDDNKQLNYKDTLEHEGYTGFKPNTHSSKQYLSMRDKEINDTGETMSMEAELKRLQQ